LYSSANLELRSALGIGLLQMGFESMQAPTKDTENELAVIFNT